MFTEAIKITFSKSCNFVVRAGEPEFSCKDVIIVVGKDIAG